jgi:uncharacterized protein HemX
MSILMRSGSPTNLARGELVLAPARAGFGWIIWCALIVAALFAGAAGSYGYLNQQRLAQAQQQSVALKDVQQLQQSQEQARLQLRVAEARGQELEHQIDSLNQRLRESQEELTFFRKSRDGKRPNRE